MGPAVFLLPAFFIIDMLNKNRYNESNISMLGTSRMIFNYIYYNILLLFS